MMTRYTLRSTWCWLFLLLGVLLACATAHPQALPTAKGPGAHVEVGAAASMFQQDYGKRYIGGSTVYADVYPHWRYGAEAEVRFLNQYTSQNVTMANYMGGLKFGIRPHVTRLQPYAKMMVGVSHIVLPFRYAEGNFLTYAPGAGLDIAVSDRVKFRAVDFEYQRWPDFPYGSLSPYGITVGVSFRLNHYQRFPKGHRDTDYWLR